MNASAPKDGQSKPLTVGQKLWFVPHRYRGNDSSRFVTIIKVGRKWAQLDYPDRMNMETMQIDSRGYSSPGRCWISQAEYEAEQARQGAWCELRTRFNNKSSAPPEVSVSQIKNALRALFKDAT